MPSIFSQINQGLAPGMQGWTGAPSPAAIATMQGTPQTRVGTPPTPRPGTDPFQPSKPGGPPNMGAMQPQKPGGPPQMGGGRQIIGGPPNLRFGSGDDWGFGARGMFTDPPQGGFPPPTGKPGAPPVNPSALNGMRPSIGPGVMPQNAAAFTQAAQAANVPQMMGTPGAMYSIGAGNNWRGPRNLY